MTKLKLRPFVVPTITALLLIIGMSFTIIGLKNSNDFDEQIENEQDHVTDTIIETQIPVIKIDNKMLFPYKNDKVKIGKYFYDYKSESNQQENSLILHKDTYIQNSGIDFICEESFEVISVLEGKVTDVSDNETLGKIVEITHDNNMISIYQSLNEIYVKKGEVISKGKVIGKSGKNELDKTLGNHLHFELYTNGQIVNPLLYLNKEIKKIKE